MPVVYLTTPGCRASLVSERIRVEFCAGNGTTEPPPPRDIHLHDVEHVVVDTRATITAAAMAECLRRRIPLVIVAGSTEVLGLCQPPSLHGRLRCAQYQRACDPAFAVAIAVACVEAKIANSRRVLQRLSSNRPGDGPAQTLAALEHLRIAALAAGSVETLRGYEGTAAGRYYEALADYFPPAAPFERRSRRPPHSAVNALLSYAYTLLVGEATAAIHASGLDGALGFLHEPDDGRPSLALDLIEPLRAAVGDALALDLLNHSIINPAGHTEHRDGGVFLNTEGRRRFFTAYERRLERPFSSEQTGQRTTLRGEIARQVASLKKSIVEGEPFEPFFMN